MSESVFFPESFFYRPDKYVDATAANVKLFAKASELLFAIEDAKPVGDKTMVVFQKEMISNSLIVHTISMLENNLFYNLPI